MVTYALLLVSTWIFLYYGSMDQLDQVKSEEIHYIDNWMVVQPDGTQYAAPGWSMMRMPKNCTLVILPGCEMDAIHFWRDRA